MKRSDFSGGKKFEEDYFGKIFPRGFEERQQINKFLVDLVLRRKSKVRRILDIGCGYGDFLSVCSRKKVAAYGVDISGYAVREAKKFVPQARITQVDVSSQRLPFKDDFFDIVSSFDVVEHLPKTDLYFAEIYRVLKKGGLFFMITPPNTFVTGIINNFFTDDPTHINRHTIEDWEEEFKRNGFRIKDIKYASFFGFPPTRYIRDVFYRCGLLVLARPFFLPLRGLCTVLYLFGEKKNLSRRS